LADNLQDLIRQIRSLGFKPEAGTNPIGCPCLHVAGMRIEMRHRLSLEFPNTITGGGQLLFGPAGQDIELGDLEIEDIESALRART
jgi:hypothetical protein